jgi:CubicO group peptidase (beta-lactamase class C family)
MDDRLERRLRQEATGDPTYEPGLVFDRLAATATTRPRPVRAAGANPSFGFAVIAVVIILSLLSLRPSLSGPGGPSPTAPATLAPSLDAGQLQSIVDAWASRNGQPGVTVTVVDATGVQVTVRHAAAGDTAPAIVRIGEVSRVFVVSTAVGLAECSSKVAVPCPLPLPAGAFSLDDPISRWLPGVPGDGLTVRKLLDGTSGLAAIAATLPDLQARIAADPGADWSRRAVLDAALAAPPRFSPGARREPVDTEFLLLEEIIGLASDRSSAEWLDVATISHLGLGNTLLATADSAGRSPGHDATGGVVSDLPPALLAVVGNAGGIASDSADLARLASAAWGSAVLRAPATIDLVTDAANGHVAPWGGSAYCPCAGVARSVIAQTGHAVAWSAVAAYDLGHRAAIGIALDADVNQAGLDDLLASLVADDGP